MKVKKEIKLFRGAIRQLEHVRNDLGISYDHGSQIVLGKKDSARLIKANQQIQKTIELLKTIG